MGAAKLDRLSHTLSYVHVCNFNTMSQNQLPGAPSNAPMTPPAALPSTSPPAPLPTPPQLQFFVARPEQNYGPYTLQEVNSHLATGHIKAADLAWHEGAPGWMPLSQLSGVVIPSVPVAPPPASYPNPHPSHPHQNSSGDPTEESVVFDTTPSVLSDFGLCAMTCGLWLAVTICRSLSTRYKLTTERLIVTSGLLSQSSEEVEIYRVKDVSVSQGALDRMLGIGTVTVIVSDASSPRIELKGISSPMQRKEQIRQMSRSSRKSEGVRSVEYLPPS